MAQSLTVDLSTCKQDGDFYFEEVHFLVEQTMFKVPRHHFEQESSVFRDMFRLPAGGDAVQDGVKKEKPIQLEGVKADDFRQLLRVLYPRNYKREYLGVTQWTSVLKLATMWEFEQVRSVAIRELDQIHIDGPTLLALAQEYNVEKWWYTALRRLASYAALTGEEIERLGLSLSMKISLFQGSVSGYMEKIKEEKAYEPKEPVATPATPSKPRPKTCASLVSSDYIDKFIEKIFPEVHTPLYGLSAGKKCVA